MCHKFIIGVYFGNVDVIMGLIFYLSSVMRTEIVRTHTRRLFQGVRSHIVGQQSYSLRRSTLRTMLPPRNSYGRWRFAARGAPALGFGRGSTRKKGRT